MKNLKKNLPFESVKMLSGEEVKKAREETIKLLEKVGFVLSPEEKEKIEVVDFGLSDLKRIGLQIIVYINTERYCAKELVLFPRQICPEHLHPPIDERNPGKQETFRCRWGEVYLHVPGQRTPEPKARPPVGKEKYYTAQRRSFYFRVNSTLCPRIPVTGFRQGTKGRWFQNFLRKVLMRRMCSRIQKSGEFTRKEKPST